MSKNILVRLAGRMIGLLPLKISQPYDHDLPEPFVGFHWLTTFLTIIMIAFLVPLNYALQGYQVISSYQTNYYTTSPHWYNKFYPLPKPGSQCDPHIFNNGDRFTTFNEGFQWSVTGGAASPTSGQSARPEAWTLTYSAQTLDSCDISQMEIAVNSVTQSGQLSWGMTCYAQDFGFTAETVLPFGDSDVSSFYGIFGGGWIQGAVAVAGWDLIYQMQNITRVNPQAPTQLLFGTSSEFPCTTILPGNDSRADAAYSTLNTTQPDGGTWCANPPNLGLVWSGLFTVPQAAPDYRPMISNAINNVFQVMLAGGRLDLGNPFPINAFNNSFLQQTPPVFLPPFTEVAPNGSLISGEGLFNSDIVNYGQLWEDAVIDDQGPYSFAHEIVVPYLCHLTVPKSAGSAIVAVFVATITMGATAWTIYTWMINQLVKLRSSSGKTEEELAEDGQALMMRPLPSTSSVNGRTPSGATTPRAEASRSHETMTLP